MTEDVYSFECDLDRNLPEDARSTFTLEDDGEHFVLGVEYPGTVARQVYLTPDKAKDLASLLDALLATTDDAEPAPATPLAVKLTTAALFIGALAGLLLGIAWVVNAVR